MRYFYQTRNWPHETTLLRFQNLQRQGKGLR